MSRYKQPFQAIITIDTDGNTQFEPLNEQARALFEKWTIKKGYTVRSTRVIERVNWFGNQRYDAAPQLSYSLVTFRKKESAKKSDESPVSGTNTVIDSQPTARIQPLTQPSQAPAQRDKQPRIGKSTENLNQFLEHHKR